MNVVSSYIDLCRSGYLKIEVICTSRWNVAIVADPSRSRPTRLVASDVIGDKPRSFLRTKSYGAFNSMVKGSQFEYDSSHLRHKQILRRASPAYCNAICCGTNLSAMYGRHNGPMGSNGNIRQCQLAHSRRCIRLFQVARRCASASRSCSV